MESGASLWELARALKKRAGLVLLATGVCALTAGVFSSFQSKVFTAKTYLLVSESKISDADPRTPSPFYNPNFVYYELLRSYETFINNDYLIEKTIQKLGLQQPPFLLNPDRFREQRILRLELSKNTRLLEVTVEFADAWLAAEIANSFAGHAVAFNQEITGRDTERSRELLKQSTDQANRQLESARKSLAKFRLTSGLEALRSSVQGLLDDTSRRETEASKLSLALDRAAARRDALARQQNDSRRLQETETEIAELTGGLKALEKGSGVLRGRLARLLAEKAQKESLLEKLTEEERLSADTYAVLTRKFQEASVTVNARSTDLKAVAPAMPSNNPIRPRILLNTVLAGGFGFLLSTLLALIYARVEAARDQARTVGESSSELRQQRSDELHEIKRSAKGF